MLPNQKVRIKSIPSHLEQADRVHIGQIGHIQAVKRNCPENLVKLQGRSWPVSLYDHNIELV